MTTGYSGRPLAAKLGIREGAYVIVLDPPADYRELLEPLPPDVTFGTELAPPDAFVHAFATERAQLEKLLPELHTAIFPNGTAWISWPKRSSGVASDIREDTIRELALPLGLVDVKVAAVDATWSGLKLVVRKELRSIPQAG